MRKLVLDANTLVSGIVGMRSGSPPARLMRALQQAEGFEIVSGDKDLLEHAGLEPGPISPREACERLGLIG